MCVLASTMSAYHAAGLLEQRVFRETHRSKRRHGDSAISLCLQAGDKPVQLTDAQLYWRCMHTTQRLQALARQHNLPVLEYVQTHADQVDAAIEHCFESRDLDALPAQGPFFTMSDGSCVCNLCLGDKYSAVEQQGARLLRLQQAVCTVHYTVPSRLKCMHRQILARRRVAARLKSDSPDKKRNQM